MNGKNDKSPHILNTSSNLMGFCFIVLTSVKIFKMEASTIIDEVTAIAIIMFMTSSILSFLSIRSNTKTGEHYENIADYIFLGGLFLLFITTILITFNLVS